MIEGEAPTWRIALVNDLALAVRNVVACERLRSLAVSEMNTLYILSSTSVVSAHWSDAAPGFDSVSESPP